MHDPDDPELSDLEGSPEPIEEKTVPWVQCVACDKWRMLKEDWPEEKDYKCAENGRACDEECDDIREQREVEEQRERAKKEEEDREREEEEEEERRRLKRQQRAAQQESIKDAYVGHEVSLWVVSISHDPTATQIFRLL